MKAFKFFVHSFKKKSSARSGSADSSRFGLLGSDQCGLCGTCHARLVRSLDQGVSG